MDNCFWYVKIRAARIHPFHRPSQIFCQNHAAEKLTKIRFLPDEQPAGNRSLKHFIFINSSRADVHLFLKCININCKNNPDDEYTYISRHF